MAKLTREELATFKAKFPEFVAFLTSEDFHGRVMNNAPNWALEKDAGKSYKRAIAASVVAAVKSNPKLLIDASIPSLFDAVGAIVRRGLTVGDNIAWLVPYGGVVSFQLGWMGLYTIAQRAGMIRNARTQPIYEHDRCLIRLGDDPGTDHQPAPIGTPRGKFVGAYVLMTLPGEDRDYQDIEYMDQPEIAMIRSRSPGKNSDAWNNWFSEMGRAKVFKRAMKRVPKPMEYDPSLMLDMDDGVVIEHGEEQVDQAALEAPKEKPMKLDEFVSEQREKEKVPVKPAYDDYLADDVIDGSQGWADHDAETGEVKQAATQRQEPKAEREPSLGLEDAQKGDRPSTAPVAPATGKAEDVALILPGARRPEYHPAPVAASMLLREADGHDTRWIDAALKANHWIAGTPLERALAGLREKLTKGDSD